VHGEFEILNGTFRYDEWCKKAKFLGVKTLGLCERNTLAGVLKFQKACKRHGIKPIIGAEYTISFEKRKESTLKLYAINETGWKNLVKINSVVKFSEVPQIDIESLQEFSEGLICIINPVDFLFNRENLKELYHPFNRYLFYQVSPVEFRNNNKDKIYLENLATFLETQLQPVLIDDTYYLEPEQSILKDNLNVIGSKPKDNFYKGTQHFKSAKEIDEILEPLFEPCEYKKFLTSCESNLGWIERTCTFEVEIGQRHLPEYVPKNDFEESFKTNFDLLYHITKDVCKKKFKDNHVYIDRFMYEISVIKDTGIADYFLILWDTVQWAEKNGILIGFGRGSAAGSLVSYLLGITKVDPIKYGLIFERFITRERVMKSLPDIDLDFDAIRKNEVKKYMEQRYGSDHFCSVGTYGTLQIKMGMKDFSRVKGLPVDYVNRINKVLDLEVNTVWENLIENAAEKPSVKDFIMKHPDIVELIQLSKGQPKSESVHACATIVLPKDMEVWDTLPIRPAVVDDKEIIVTEWEGEELDEAGFLKEDILGLHQLTKIQMIKDLVKKHYDEDIDIYELPIDDAVFEMFRNGHNADIFQFGTKIAVKYCKEFQPYNFEELALMVAICRPGPMESGTDTRLVKIKFGQEEEMKRPGLEEITKETFGLLIYQEQIMQVFVKLAGVSLVESDDIRRALGKKKIEVIMPYHDKFIQGGMANGYDKDYLEDLWEEMVKFSGYSFNRSHAVVYAMPGLVAQWLKWKYPVEFWTTAFSTSKQEEHDAFVSEIMKTKTVELAGVNINISDKDFKPDVDNMRIYWSLSVKQCGEVAMQEILAEREKNGQFFSLKEFLSRVPKDKVNKRVVENLIYAGAFDELENIKNVNDRLRLFNELKEFVGKSGDFTKIDKAISGGVTSYEWWWLLKQKEVSEFSFFDYDSIIKEGDWKKSWKYMSIEELLNSKCTTGCSDYPSYLFAGIIKEIDIKKDANEIEFARLLLENNYSVSWYYIKGFDNWANTKNEISGARVGDIFVGNGNPIYNKWMKQNIMQAVKKFEFEFLSTQI
jgi:DNA polymerase-3 subunit alpha